MNETKNRAPLYAALMTELGATDVNASEYQGESIDGTVGDVRLWVHGAREPGKICVSASFAPLRKESHGRWFPDYAPYNQRSAVVTEIKVAESKGAERIAKEIRRRLLEPLAPLVAEARRRYDETNARDSKQEAVLAELIAKYPGRLKRMHFGGGRTKRERGEELGLYVEGPAIHCVKTYDGEEFRLESVRVNRAQLEAVLAVLADAE